MEKEDYSILTTLRKQDQYPNLEMQSIYNMTQGQILGYNTLHVQKNMTMQLIVNIHTSQKVN